MSKIRGTTVKSSEIHGKGLFSEMFFRAGDMIGAFKVVESRRDGKYRIWVEIDDGHVRPFRAINNLKYANHSDLPNAELDGLHMYAIRPILPGEEITFHYGEDW